MIEASKCTSKASVSRSKGCDGKEKIQINYKALDMIYTAIHGMQRMSSFGQFRTMIGDEVLNDFRDEDLVLDVKGSLNVEGGCYTWYMSVKNRGLIGIIQKLGRHCVVIRSPGRMNFCRIFI